MFSLLIFCYLFFNQKSLFYHQSTTFITSAYSTNNLYQPSSSNISNNVVKRVTSRNVRPPSCARPTISSLRKMNRTFSLNNVSEAGLNNPNNNKNIAAINNNNNNNNINNPNGNIILPLTKASLAMANASSSSFNSTAFINNNHNNGSRYSTINCGAESPLNMLNESAKFQSKYASSTYLNDTASSNSRKIFQPQQTRTTPRRRTPRNAEEYLLANGVDDTKSFMSKGYYVGSMVNLNEYAGKSTNIPNNNNNQSQNQNEQNTTSSSSSSMQNQSNFKLNQQQQQPQSTSPNDILNESFNSVKRRNSIHDTTSVSLANLNFLNSNFSGGHNNFVAEENHHHHKLIKNNYRNKARSNTTAIVLTNHNNDGNQSDPSQNGDGSTTGGSSLPGSETSSSPNPLKPSKHSLGPLMSAVSKADESLLSPSNNNSNNNSNNHTNNKYMLGGNGSGLDDYDDYEYLERNFGAEPSFNNSPTTNPRNNKNNDTTTNTNVTDYYTDESSYNNEDFKNNNKNSKRNNRFGLNIQNTNTNNNNVSFNNNNNNNNINVLKQQQLIMQQQQHIQQTPSSQITANGMNGWDNGSITSNNSMLSGNSYKNSK
jgi:hypothetical protein